MAVGLAALPMLPSRDWMTAAADDPGDEEVVQRAPNADDRPRIATQTPQPRSALPQAASAPSPPGAQVLPAEAEAVATLPAHGGPRPVADAPAVAAGDPGASSVGAGPAPAAVAGVDTRPRSAAQLFGAVKQPAQMATRVIGTYAKGCIAGAQALPVTGPSWQVMRLKRNRNWGHPSLVDYIERLANDARENDGWPGLLVGDMSQPRGGPMTFGHASHQVGLDVDIWYAAMPDHELSRRERDDIKLSSVLDDSGHVDRDIWTTRHIDLIRRAASDSRVERVFVHPAIKKELCETIGEDRGFLKKVRPFWGHDDHFHVRLSCPPDSAECQRQPAVASDEGCGKELDSWVKRVARPAVAAAPAPAGGSQPVPAVQSPPVAQPAPLPRPVAAPPASVPSAATPTYDSAPVASAAARLPRGLEKLPLQCRVVLAAAPGGEPILNSGH